MFDFGLFRKPAFTGAQIVAFTISSSMFALFLYFTLYLQDSSHYSPLQAGLRFLPLSLISFFVAPIAGRLSARIPVRILFGVGMALVGVALLSCTGSRRRRAGRTCSPASSSAASASGWSTRRSRRPR